MDAAKTRNDVNAHADAIARGDLDAAAADLSEELRPHADEMAQVLPLPVASAEVLSVEVGPDEAVSLIRYTGTDAEVTIRGRWQDRGDRPVMVGAEPVQ
jgi:hypothetical protein